jgi:hypothetical protein
VTVTAKATDRAGNVRTASVKYTVSRFYLVGVTYSHGAYQVKEGHTYVLVALTSGSARPRYYDAAPKGHRPHPPGSYLHRSGSQSGLHRFTLSVRIDRHLGRYKYWVLGVKTGSTMHRLTVHPAR